MATLLLTGAVGSLNLTGWALFGANLAATAVGTLIDGHLFNQNKRSEGPRLQEISISSSTEGSTVKRLFGTLRVGGTLIWATNFKETITTETVGGKGIEDVLPGAGGAETTNYEYSISFAVAFCEGGVGTKLGKMWVDGKLLDISKYNYRWYEGSDDQLPDSLIQQVEGVDKTPGYRGIAYLVFEDLPLREFGNRIPQITAEITKPIYSANEDSYHSGIKALSFSPGLGEFALGISPISADDGEGNSGSENSFTQQKIADLSVSIYQLQTTFLDVQTISFSSVWFGNDLRAGSCEIKPRVESSDKVTSPMLWSVNGLNRSGVPVISLDDSSRPIYEGTPSDKSIVEFIIQFKANGYKVAFTPMIFLDIPEDNILPNPYSDSESVVEQPKFPHRNKITCSPAIGFFNSVDQTVDTSTQIDDFFGNADVTDFSVSGIDVSWTGGADWGLRRMVLHYALLCKAAGGVDYFLISDELTSLVRCRSDATTFPAVDKLVELLEDVRAIGGVADEISYSAGIREYHSYRSNDSQDVFFNLDPLWNVADFVGISSFISMSDWRDGTSHLDFSNAVKNIYDTNYLKSNIEGGEGYSWEYETNEARNIQSRKSLVDPSYDKPWVFRDKDIRSWWSNSHYNRVLDVEEVTSTDWIPESKRVIFTYFACQSIDKATNDLQRTFDYRSSESAIPFFSSSEEDFSIQRIAIESFLSYWRENGGEFLVPEDIWIGSWDARPYPYFPDRSSRWPDTNFWSIGTDINGKIEKITVADLIRELCDLVNLGSFVETTNLADDNSFVNGYLIDSIMSPRDMISPVLQTFMLDANENSGKIYFSLRNSTIFTAITDKDLVIEGSNSSGFSLIRQQESELLRQVAIDFIDRENSYQIGSTSGTRSEATNFNVSKIQLPLALDQGYVRSLADQIVQESWAQRESGEMSLSSSLFKLDPGDGLLFDVDGRQMKAIITSSELGNYRKVSFLSHEPAIYEKDNFSGRSQIRFDPNAYGKSVVEFLDIPILTGEERSPWAPRIAAYQNPFPVGVNIYLKDTVTSGLTLLNSIPQKTEMGRTLTSLVPGLPWVINYEASLEVKVSNINFQPTSNTEEEVFAGENAIAVKNSDGFWEIIQYVNVTLLTSSSYRLSGLIRGQLGTEADMVDIPINSRVVFLRTKSLSSLGISVDQKKSTLTYRYGASENDVAGANYVDETLTFRAVGLMPYAPGDVQAQRVDPSGDMEISWKRRTRFNGDSWEEDDVPLNEEYEQYDLEIWNGGSVVKLIAGLSNPLYTYTSADQILNFGSVQDSVHVKVYQISSTVGRGHAADKVVTI